jgi:Tol biopolymer transport system component
MASAALAGLWVFVVFDRSGAAESQSASPTHARALAAGLTSSKIAYISATRSPSSGRGAVNALYVMNADGSARRLVSDHAFIDPSWSPDGRRLAFVTAGDRAGSEIHVVAVDGSGEQRLTRNHADFAPVWSPDGRKLAFARGADRADVYVMSADGSGQRMLTRGALYAVPLSWSPDGQRIGFSDSRGPWTASVFVMNRDGSGKRKLTRELSVAGGPAVWSPDWTRVAVAIKRDGKREVYVVNVDGTPARRLTSNPADELPTSWSPGGTRILFTRERGEQADIYVMNADGSGQQRLMQRGRQPLWSPDGQRIAFRSSRDGNPELYVMNADGNGVHHLTHASTRTADSIAWSPAPR